MPACKTCPAVNILHSKYHTSYFCRMFQKPVTEHSRGYKRECYDLNRPKAPPRELTPEQKEFMRELFTEVVE